MILSEKRISELWQEAWLHCEFERKSGGVALVPEYQLFARAIVRETAQKCADTVEDMSMPTLPKPLLNAIGEYGMARTDDVSELERLHRWEKLIDSIKLYARNVAAEALRKAAS